MATDAAELAIGFSIVMETSSTSMHKYQTTTSKQVLPFYLHYAVD